MPFCTPSSQAGAARALLALNAAQTVRALIARFRKVAGLTHTAAICICFVLIQDFIAALEPHGIIQHAHV